jgi:hypothetical protein
MGPSFNPPTKPFGRVWQRILLIIANSNSLKGIRPFNLDAFKPKKRF